MNLIPAFVINTMLCLRCSSIQAPSPHELLSFSQAGSHCPSSTWSRSRHASLTTAIRFGFALSYPNQVDSRLLEMSLSRRSLWKGQSASLCSLRKERRGQTTSVMSTWALRKHSEAGISAKLQVLLLAACFEASVWTLEQQIWCVL